MNLDSHQAKAVFLEAVEKHDPEQWPAYLDQACAGQPELRQRVAVLLQAHREASTAPLRPRPERAAPGDVGGTRIGRYKLLQPIGEGGMGVVWMAEQQE